MDEKKIVSYDPMTGEPVYEEAANSTVNEPAAEAAVTPENTMQYQEVPQYTATPVEEPEKKKSLAFPLLLVIIPILIVAAIVVAVICFSGKPKDKVADAIKKTFENLDKGDNLLLTALVPTQFMEEKEMTLNIEGEVTETWYDETVSFDAKIAENKDTLQIDFGIEVPDYPYVDGTLEWNDSQIKIASPLLSNMYVYDYTKDCDGFIGDAISETGISVDDLNKEIKSFYELAFKSLNDPKEIMDKLGAVKDVYDEIDIKKTDSEEFTVDDKDVKCKGYEMIIDEDAMSDLIDAYMQYIVDFYGEEFVSMLEELTGESLDDLMEEAAEEMKDSIEGMDDISLRCYIYKGELAAIVIESEGDEIEIAFEGGDYRLQNITIEVDGDKAKIEGEKDGDVETCRLKVGKEELFAYEYDSESGDIKISVEGEEYFDGLYLINEKNEWSFGLKDYEDEYEGIKIDFDMSLEKGADFEDMDGDEFLLNDASEDDLMEAVESEISVLSEFMY